MSAWVLVLAFYGPGAVTTNLVFTNKEACEYSGWHILKQAKDGFLVNNGKYICVKIEGAKT